MQIEFTSELETGNRTIDSQHKEWIKRYNAFIVCLKKGEGRKNLSELLLFLDEYTHSHFSAEEALMNFKKYSGLKRHKALHNDFKKVLKEFKNDLQKDGAGVHLAIKANQLIGDWLRNHILGVDKDMVAKLK
jgi:hemerythrin